MCPPITNGGLDMGILTSLAEGLKKRRIRLVIEERRRRHIRRAHSWAMNLTGASQDKVAYTDEQLEALGDCVWNTILACCEELIPVWEGASGNHHISTISWRIDSGVGMQLLMQMVGQIVAKEIGDKERSKLVYRFMRICARMIDRGGVKMEEKIELIFNEIFSTERLDGVDKIVLTNAERANLIKLGFKVASDDQLYWPV
jgi:hypothetical protein